MCAGGPARQDRVGDDHGAAETRRERQLIPSEIEEHRDRCWQRENTVTVETAADAERRGLRPARGRALLIAPRMIPNQASAKSAVREIARCFLTGAGMTFPGEMARGVYRLTTLGTA